MISCCINLFSGSNDFRFEDATTNIVVNTQQTVPVMNRIGFRGDDVAQELSETFQLELVVAFGGSLPLALQAENTFFASVKTLTIIDQTGIF